MRITQRLVAEKNFRAVCWEADWPSTREVNRFIQGQGPDEGEAIDCLAGFGRWPQWMWRNSVVLESISCLRDHNEQLPPEDRVGVYGLDLYSMYASQREVCAYLDEVDAPAAARARAAYACFSPGEDSQVYGRRVGLGLSKPCEEEAVRVLAELQQRRTEGGGRGAGAKRGRDPGSTLAVAATGSGAVLPLAAARSRLVEEDEAFYAEENARMVVDAEKYYREMFRGRVSSWNIRDRHMFTCLQSLIRHLEATRRAPKVVIWAHNSHLGDARATEMSARGELNLGQLVRQAYGPPRPLGVPPQRGGLGGGGGAPSPPPYGGAYCVGFSTFAGHVTAGSDWDGVVERKRVRPAVSGSYESLFHDVAQSPRECQGKGDKTRARAVAILKEPRLQRAIGVIYKPETERASHLFHACLPDQFDTIIHIDHTRAVEPLERTALWHTGEAEETFPSGL